MNPLIHAPIDKWSTREKLSLASSVLTAGDQNWYSVSRSLRPFGELNRPQDWFSQKNCALQYAELLENVETPKRKRGEKNEDTAQNLIVRKLTVERMKELREEIERDEKQLENLKKNINLLKNDNLSETDKKIIEKQMIDALELKRRDEEAYELWLKEREEKYASISRKKSFALMKTPRKDDQTTPSTPNKPTTPLSIQPAPQPSQKQTPQEQRTDEMQIDTNKIVTPAEQFTIKQEKLSTQEINEQQVTANKMMTREKSKDADKIQVVLISDEKRPSNDKTLTVEQAPNDEKTADKQSKVIDLTRHVSDKNEVIVSPVAEVVKMEVENIESTTNQKGTTKNTEDERLTDETKEEIESIASNKRKRTAASISLSTPTNTPTIVQQQPQTPANTINTPQTRRSGRLNPLRSSTLSKSEQSPAVEQLNQTPISKKQQPPAQIVEEKPIVIPSIKASQILLNDESTKDSTTSDLTDTYTSPNSPASSILNIDHNDPEQMKEQREFKTWKKSILLLWREIATHKFSTLFTSPVTDDDAKGYSTVVFRPIDLTTIRRKVESGEIRTTLEFQRDILLMFQNAIMYNSVQHEVHRMSAEMQKEVLESIEDFIASQKSSSSSQASKEAPLSRRKSRTT